jgi:hypothetical protein
MISNNHELRLQRRLRHLISILAMLAVAACADAPSASLRLVERSRVSMGSDDG